MRASGTAPVAGRESEDAGAGMRRSAPHPRRRRAAAQRRARAAVSVAISRNRYPGRCRTCAPRSGRRQVLARDGGLRLRSCGGCQRCCSSHPLVRFESPAANGPVVAQTPVYGGGCDRRTELRRPQSHSRAGPSFRHPAATMSSLTVSFPPVNRLICSPPDGE